MKMTVISFPEDVNVPRGFSCYDKDELVKAKLILKESGVSKMLIKNTVGTNGKGIYEFETDDEFEEILNKLIFKQSEFRKYKPAFTVEEYIDVQLNKHGGVLSPSTHSIGYVIFTGICNQLLNKFKFKGSNSLELEDSVAEECFKQTKLLNEALNLKGPMSIDFVLDKNFKPYVTHINVGRMSGSHYTRIFMNMYSPNKKYYLIKVNALTESLIESQNKLEVNRLNFDFQKRKGIIFQRVYDTYNFCILCKGDSDEEIKDLIQAYNKIF